MMEPSYTSGRPRIAVSACVLGEPVRYNGGHKRSLFATESLAGYVEWVPVCPEVAIGLGVPRDPMQLIEGDGGARLMTRAAGTDHTDAMTRWADGWIDEAERLELDGLLLKDKSPSCGMSSVEVYPRLGSREVVRRGAGLFAGAARDRLPSLPSIDDARLHDQPEREGFLSAVFTHHRLRTALIGAARPADALVRVHGAHKLLFMAHSPDGQKRLGRRVATSPDPLPYIHEAMDVLRSLPSTGKHVNVMHHMMGYFKDDLSSADKSELLDVIEGYRRGAHPLTVPLTLLSDYTRRSTSAGWLVSQVYFAPFPAALRRDGSELVERAVGTE